MKTVRGYVGLFLIGALAGVSYAETADEFGKRMNKLIATDDMAGLGANFDKSAFLEGVTRNVQTPPGAKETFGKGMGDFGLTFYKRILDERGPTGSYRYLHTVKRDDGERALFRLVNQDGALNYHEAILQADANGQLKIIDAYIHATGETLVQSVRRPYVRMAVAINNNNNAKQPAPEWLVAYEKVQQAKTAGDFKGVLAAYDALPENQKRDKLLSLYRVLAAMQLGDQVYLPILKQHIDQFGTDATVALLSVDLHLLNKDFPKAQQAVDEIDKIVGGDPYLDVLRANIYATEGAQAKVVPSAEKALKREPTLIPAADIILTDALARKDHKAACDMMVRMEKQMDFRFGDYAAAELFKDFASSSEAARFEKERPKK